MKPHDPTHDPNKGEDEEGARRYHDDVREFMAEGKVEPAADEARIFLEQEPEEAARAERAGKRGPRRGPRVSVDELVAKGKTYVDRARPVVRRAVDRVRARLGRK